MILYEGPSRLKPSENIVVIAIISSKNEKTGNMIQTYILLKDRHPVEVVRENKDDAICGNCPLRGHDGFHGRVCYVSVEKAPSIVWKNYKKGKYQQTSDFSSFYGRNLRIGTYGDPCAVPVEIWKNLLTFVKGWTGYTHQWRDERNKEYQNFLMASVESVFDGYLAELEGWRYFRIVPSTETNKVVEENDNGFDNWKIQVKEILCPASEEMGKKTDCKHCNLCSGGQRKKNVVIHEHEKNSRWRWKKLFETYGKKQFNSFIVSLIERKMEKHKRMIEGRKNVS